jgi:uncharacterized membrane protein YkoI
MCTGLKRRSVNIRSAARTLALMHARSFATIFLMLAQAMSVSSAQSLVDPRGRDRAEESVNQSGGMSLDEAVRMVENRYRARAVKAETVNNGGRRIHEIRLLNSDGKVWKVRIDAETGQSY